MRKNPQVHNTVTQLHNEVHITRIVLEIAKLYRKAYSLEAGKGTLGTNEKETTLIPFLQYNPGKVSFSSVSSLKDSKNPNFVIRCYSC